MAPPRGRGGSGGGFRAKGDRRRGRGGGGRGGGGDRGTPFKARGGGRGGGGRGGHGGRGGMKGGSRVVVEPHRHEGIFITKGKEDALVTKNLVPGEAVYNEKRITVQEGLAPINLIVENDLHRATPGGTGGVKTIGNYAAVLKAHSAAKAKGYSDVLYLDCVHKRYSEEVSSCNIFVVKGNIISTPSVKGTILPGVT